MSSAGERSNANIGEAGEGRDAAGAVVSSPNFVTRVARPGRHEDSIHPANWRKKAYLTYCF